MLVRGCCQHDSAQVSWSQIWQHLVRWSDFTFTFHFHALEKEMATHSSVLAWRIPGTAKPGGLRSMGSQSRTGLTRLSSSSRESKGIPSCPTLCNLIDGSPPGSPIPGILQARTLEWVASKNTGVGCHFLLRCRKVKSESEVAQSCPTLSDPMDCSPPGSSAHGIFQARELEWGAIGHESE